MKPFGKGHKKIFVFRGHYHAIEFFFKHVPDMLSESQFLKEYICSFDVFDSGIFF